MKKYIIVLSALSATASAHGKWDVGVAAGWGSTKTSEKLIVRVTVPAGYKYTLKQNGPVGGITTGYTVQSNQNTFGASAGIYKDFYTARNAGNKRDFIGGTHDDFTKDLKRIYTLELAGKIGRKLNADLHLYGKLGVVHSKFNEQYKDIGSDVRKTLHGWGGVAGIGLQKTYESFTLGVEYDYHHYERIGSKVNFVIGTTGVQNHSRIKPQYHNVFLTISKSF